MSRMLRESVVAPVLGVALLGCSGPGGEPVRSSRGFPPSDPEVLALWLSGSYSSAAQAADDPENYLDVRLRIVPIWPERPGGHWLYVEQALASSESRPYRQRVYRIVPGAARGTLESLVFELPGDPLVFAGAWRSPALLDGVEASSLVQREGCTVVLRAGDGVFAGGTVGNACASTLRGAAYATSEVTLTPAMLESWDRGFDAQGRQVWGAEKGGYVFVKESPPEPEEIRVPKDVR